ncbi:MAG: DUF507 family protein [Nitrospinae bacterium]|nr:DUF507 family protein [Nitrospinota bacterium]MZH41778.1 DUF507 family protein [Nitrospinota bacterium]
MKISREKINHISSLIIRDFAKRDELDYKVELNDIRLEITRVMTDILQYDDKADAEARRILSTYANAPREGSPEWDIMYQKHFDEYMNKQGL